MTQHPNSMKSVYDSFLQHTLSLRYTYIMKWIHSSTKLTAPTIHMNIACQTDSKLYIGYLKTLCTFTVFNRVGWKSHLTPSLPQTNNPVPLNTDSIQYYYLSGWLQNTLSTPLFTKKVLKLKGIFTDYDQRQENFYYISMNEKIQLSSSLGFYFTVLTWLAEIFVWVRVFVRLHAHVYGNWTDNQLTSKLASKLDRHVNW